MTAALIRRYLQPRIEDALLDTPVVLVNGPRQAGKTTLVRQFADAARTYVTLDDAATLAGVRHDPVGFVRDLDMAVIDEVQRAPELLLAIKQSVDQDRRPGRFLLTGSANVMTLPRVADSLAGRIETHTLLPLAGCEVQGSAGHWLDAVFAGAMPRPPRAQADAEVGAALVQRVLRGGYPQALARPTARRREAWLHQYVETLIQRDVRDIAAVDKLEQLPRLLTALALMAGQLCNFAQLAGQIGLDNKTAEKYLGIFEQMFLLRRVRQWSGNGLARIVKSPKVQFIDSGLLCGLLGVNEDLLLRRRQHIGAVLESHVQGELLKQAAWAQEDYQVLTFRTMAQAEVDFVLENRRGEIVGVEVKAAASFQAADFLGLKKLATLAGERFLGGVLLYDGTQTLPMGEVAGKPLWAVPLSTLWLT
jgi:predicted AAA+ superfamily ATPase